MKAFLLVWPLFILPAFAKEEVNTAATPSVAYSKMVGQKLRFLSTSLTSYSLRSIAEQEIGLTSKRSVKVIDHSKAKLDDCQTKYDELLTLHNEVVDLLTTVAKNAEKVDNTDSRQEKCTLLKQASIVLNKADEKTKRGWKMAKKAIESCADSEGLETVTEVANGIEKCQELIDKWTPLLKESMASSCK